MPTLDGKTYEMQYLTDEETAVINAMRRGATVDARFYESTHEAAEANKKELEQVSDSVLIRELRTGTTNQDFTAYEIHIGQHTICHYIYK